MTTVEVPNIGRVQFPESMSQAQIVAAIQNMQGQSPRGIDPNTGRHDPDLAIVDGLLANPPPQATPATFADKFRNMPLEQSLPLMGATMGSIAFPPLAAGRAVSALPGVGGLLSRGMQRFGPPALAAAFGGGGAAGGLEAERPGATPGSIAQEALGTGAKFAGAELAGMGIGAGVGRMLAPRLGFLDPLKGIREQFGAFVKTVPERTRAAAKRVEELLPAGARTAAEAAHETSRQATKIFRELVEQSTRTKTAQEAAAQLGNRKATAAAVARSLGDKASARLGFKDGENSAEFLFRVFESGGAKAMSTLQKRMTKRQLEDFQLQTLAQLIERASVRGRDGVRRLNGEKLAQVWDDLPAHARSLYSPGTQRAIQSLATFGSAASRVARFAATPTGSEFAEAIVTPAAFAVGGPALGIPLMAAKALLFPGPLVRYLTRDKLPSDVVQMIGGQTVKTGFRTGLLEERE